MTNQFLPAAPLVQEVGLGWLNVAAGTATTTVKTGQGVFRSITINTKGGSANTLTIYDGGASGTKIATIDTTVAALTLTFNVQFLTSLVCVSTTGTGADYTVVYSVMAKNDGIGSKDGYRGAPPAKDEAERERRRAKGRTTHDRRAMLTQHLIAELNSVDPVTQMTKARTIIVGLVELAMAKDIVAIKDIYDRVEGKARQQVDVTHDGDLNVRSAAISVLDELVEEAARGRAGRVAKDPLPN